MSFSAYLKNWSPDIKNGIDLISFMIEKSQTKEKLIRHLYLATLNNAKGRAALMFVIENKYPEYKLAIEKLMVLE